METQGPRASHPFSFLVAPRLLTEQPLSDPGERHQSDSLAFLPTFATRQRHLPGSCCRKPISWMAKVWIRHTDASPYRDDAARRTSIRCVGRQADASF